uniref:SET domain-containing protein n=1 Tax=Oryza punctata TaxID=4537 RepID=A0A0E0M0D1_ORYPU
MPQQGEPAWYQNSVGNIQDGEQRLGCKISELYLFRQFREMLQENGDEHVETDEYLFDIGHHYHDEVWEDRKSGIWGLDSSTSKTTEDTEGSTIDASKCSNVGRFINHSCSPNLYAQNVLWDHDDMKKPHIMFFATENIPPLQELTYDYNYGKVEDKNGKEKVKPCFCGSPDCSRRLY